MLKRIISGVVGIPLLFFIISRGDFILYFSVMAVAIVGLYEFYNAMKVKGLNPMTTLGYFISTGILMVFIYSRNDLLLFFLFITIITISGILLMSFKYTVIDGSITIYGVLYVTVFLGHIILTDKLENSAIIWLIFIIAWATDTFAYFGGFFWGKRKLCPEISPKKTIEGAIAGVLGSMFACGFFGYLFLSEYSITIIILGMVGSVISQAGDLTASQIKRYAGVKDYGNLIPGHGGILDRFDSILFTAPTVFYFYTLFIK
ncbi:MAG: phosphatidate cytidylyltransferase [Clostridiaceae bacterium]|nr:phosphatidate cytidylyltransferase [Clostridiaceae bacterium]